MLIPLGSAIRVNRLIPRFVVVGLVGFFVDAGLLTLLSVNAAINVYLARLISFVAASATTWWLNRSLTFQSRSERHVMEWSRYMVVQIGGAAINMGIFAIVVLVWPLLRNWPILPLAVGASGGLVFNYLLSKHWVFRK